MSSSKQESQTCILGILGAVCDIGKENKKSCLKIVWPVFHFIFLPLGENLGLHVSVLNSEVISLSRSYFLFCLFGVCVVEWLYIQPLWWVWYCSFSHCRGYGCCLGQAPLSQKGKMKKEKEEEKKRQKKKLKKDFSGLFFMKRISVVHYDWEIHFILFGWFVREFCCLWTSYLLFFTLSVFSPLHFSFSGWINCESSLCWVTSLSNWIIDYVIGYALQVAI